MVEKLKGTHGGKRAGAGMPKGYKLPTTVKKEEAKAILQEMVLSRLKPIVESGIESAMGIKHFMLRDPLTGQFQRLTDPKEIDAALSHPDAKEGSSYWIFTKDPSNEARRDILDRAIGKPIEEQNVNLTVNTPLADKIKNARKRIGN